IPLQTANVQIQPGGPSIPAWQVSRWSQGTTEQGSSGSGLWNESRRVVGVLSGGSAACSGSVDDGRSDFYARLDRQWQANAAADGQLKAWLDPIGSGAREIAGRSADGRSDGGGGGGAIGLVSLLLLCGMRLTAGWRR